MPDGFKNAFQRVLVDFFDGQVPILGMIWTESGDIHLPALPSPFSSACLALKQLSTASLSDRRLAASFSFLRAATGSLPSLRDARASRALLLASAIDTSGHGPSPISRRFPATERRSTHLPACWLRLTNHRPCPSAYLPAVKLLAFIGFSVLYITVVHLLAHPFQSTLWSPF